MRSSTLRVRPALAVALSVALIVTLAQAPPTFGQHQAATQERQTASPAADGDASYDDLLLSGRMEIINLLNVTDTIREGIKEKNRFYFNNIFLNLEGGLGRNAEFIIEYQPLTSDLYLLGGYLTIAEALEGVGQDEPGEPTELTGEEQRKDEIDRLITAGIRELDRQSEGTNFERAQITFFINDGLGVKLGRVRNPFGFWDDYSLFRNLSALKTDPVSLGVSLRRADLGVVAFGKAWGTSYQLGLLQGDNALSNKDLDNFKDIALTVGRDLGPLDLAANVYLHDVGRGSEPTNALGLSYRYRATYNLTLLGEFIAMENERIDVKTRGFYVQGNYDLSDYLADGLRWNMFFEIYDSDLLSIDLEPGLDYRFAGTYFQASTGFVYALNRSIDLGAKILSGADEEGDPFFKAAVKIDAKF